MQPACQLAIMSEKLWHIRSWKVALEDSKIENAYYREKYKLVKTKIKEALESLLLIFVIWSPI